MLTRGMLKFFKPKHEDHASVHTGITYKVFFESCSRSLKVVHDNSIPIITCNSKNVTLRFSKIKIFLNHFSLMYYSIPPKRVTETKQWTKMG